MRADPRPSQATKSRIILDTDTGVDDALAICLAMRSPELDVVALTTVSGNVAVELCTANALRVLDVIDPPRRPPVFKGEATPLLRPLVTAPEVHSDDGLGGATRLRLPDGSFKYPPSPVPPAPEPAPEAILDLIAAYPDELTLIAVGPLTNLARAMSKDRARMRRLQRIVAMGGAFRVYGNTTPVAEFNFYVDPHAAAMVLDLGVPMTLVPLDVTQQCILRPEHLQECSRGQGGTATGPGGGFGACPSLIPFIADVCAGYLRYHGLHDGFSGSYLHDPLAVGVVVDPTLVETRAAAVRVETVGEHTLGMTIADLRERPRWRDAPNADVCVAVDAGRFLRLFLARVQGTL